MRFRGSLWFVIFDNDMVVCLFVDLVLLIWFVFLFACLLGGCGELWFVTDYCPAGWSFVVCYYSLVVRVFGKVYWQPLSSLWPPSPPSKI